MPLPVARWHSWCMKHLPDGKTALENDPALWLAHLPVLHQGGHKYERGHLLCVSGSMLHTGAARLAAMAGLRIGAGLVTLASPPDALGVNAAHLTAIMLARMEGADGLGAILADKRISAVVLGPALGVGQDTRDLVRAALAAARPCVIDADGLTSFADDLQSLFGAIAANPAATVLTPHAGEFARLFGGFEEADRAGAAQRAANASGALVVLKGAQTVIAAPNGALAVNAHASPFLATAGSGDVLAGMTGGLLAQGMAPFAAACAAVWMHGDAGLRCGAGLIAEDLPGQLGTVLAQLHRRRLQPSAM